MEGTLTGCAWAQALTDGIHTKEALDLVREHVRGIMGPAAVAFSNAMIKMSKLQAAQVGHISCSPHRGLVQQCLPGCKGRRMTSQASQKICCE